MTGFAFKSDNYSNAEDDIRLLRGDNIEPGNLRWRDAKYWPKGELNNLEKYYLADGDFVIALDRTWVSSGLKVAEVTPSDLPCLLVQRVARIRAKATLEQSLLRQYFSGHKFEQHVKSVQTATAVPHISPNDIKEFTVSLPPILEQKKIAKILSTWDKAITTTEQLLANSQQQKKSLMQQLLTGKKRLLDNNEVRFVGEWKYVVLGCVFEKISNGVTYDAKSLSGLPVTRIETISTGEIDFKKVGWAPDSENTKRFKLEIGDILYSHINSLEHIGRVAYFNDNRSLYHGMNLLLLRTKKQNNSLFFYHLLNSQVGKKYAKLYAKSAVNQASISTTDIKAFKVYIPESEEQQKIATVLSTADQEIASLQQKLDALKLEKKALMQQLLTGKRRVKIDLMVL
ncbi:restriction endonuclease subunit S [Aeromonas caviae]|uniref:restriction endonuclease subunit S n=1 Tax=Aeromonas caviae TaxID=648 RepID=UPI0024493112|nr:restriction endonuclease subunit S [Aeromonas caviae]MDH0476269.1 restriction endonuclease subunit S [Aeromonas caviae]